VTSEKFAKCWRKADGIQPCPLPWQNLVDQNAALESQVKELKDNQHWLVAELVKKGLIETPAPTPPPTPAPTVPVRWQGGTVQVLENGKWETKWEHVSPSTFNKKVTVNGGIYQWMPPIKGLVDGSWWYQGAAPTTAPTAQPTPKPTTRAPTPMPTARPPTPAPTPCRGNSLRYKDGKYQYKTGRNWAPFNWQGSGPRCGTFKDYIEKGQQVPKGNDVQAPNGCRYLLLVECSKWANKKAAANPSNWQLWL